MSKIAFPRTLRNTDVTQLSRALDENMRYLERLLNATFEMDHDRLSNITSGQHHVKYTDAEVDAIVATHDAIVDAHHAKYTDSDAVTAMGVLGDANPLNHDQGGGGGAGYRETVVFTSDGTFDKADYAWLTHVRVRVQAAGGAGGGTPATSTSEWAAGGGGGGGGYSEVTIEVADLATSETVQVGVKGEGVSAADGEDGEDSLFGTQGKAIGGKGGIVGNVTATNAFTSKSGGLGGSTGTAIGDLTMDGGAGDSGVGWSQYSIGQDGGSGGESIMGGRARGGKQDGGSWGLNYGGGGGGSAIYASQAATVGAKGGDGIVVVELFDKSGGGLPPFDHGNDLTGQADDDHTQYLLVDGTRELEHEAWNTPTLLNSWVDFGAGEQTSRYRRDSSGNVWVQGAIKSGTTTTGTILYTLPAGYRPDGNLHLAVISNNVPVNIKVGSNGELTVRTGWDNTWVHLSLVFPASGT